MSSGQTLGQVSYSRMIAGSLASAGVFRLDTARTRKVRKEKEKKMGWFKRKFAQWSREAWESARKEKAYATDSVRAHDGVNGKSSVRFTIHAASGGYVIEHYKHDRMRDSDGPTLTIVNNGDSIGQAIEHVIAIEALKA